jgi:hypothetical protein
MANSEERHRFENPDGRRVAQNRRTTVAHSRGVRFMCDYSLHNVTSRPAKIDDKLVSTKFSCSTTRGFAAVGEPNVAVCLRPGTEVAFEREVEYERGWGILRKHTIPQKEARFRQVDNEKQGVHHDALEFPNGQIVLVHNLREGQHVTVLQLPASSRTANAEAERTSSSLVS